MPVVDFIENHLRSGKIVVNGINRRRSACVINKTDTDIYGTSCSSGTIRGVKILSCFDIFSEFGSIAVRLMPAGKYTGNISEVGNTAKRCFDQF